MVAQRIEYAKRADGKRTALSIFGSGPHLVVPPGWISHLEWREFDPYIDAFLGRLAESCTVVVYDRHGCGLSDRNRTDFSYEADVLDLEAVVDHLGLQKFPLFGISAGGPVSLLYTSRHSERVSRLVLYGTTAGYAAGEHPRDEASRAALAAFVRANWGIASKTLAIVFFPSGADQETLDRFARLQRISTTAETAARLLEGMASDLRPLLQRMTLPVLVCHRRGDQAVSFAAGRELAALLPNARFLPLDGDMHHPAYGDTESVLQPALQFLAEDGEPTPPGPRSQGGLQTLLFTDIEGHTPMMQRLGDARGRDVLREHERRVREALRAHGGSEIKAMGDGFLATFGSVQKALECAIALERAFAAAGKLAGNEQVRLRIGLNAGEPIAEDDDVFGSSVILAARVASKAEGGQVYVTNVVRELAAGKGFLFADAGEFELRGFEEAVRLWELRWEA
jgi:class 3 adenylate cyclase